MPSATVRDLTLVLDGYTTTLSEGWPEERQQPIVQPLNGSLSDLVAKLLKEAPSDERFGEVLFDWALLPESEIRRAFLQHCENGGQQRNLVRLWIGIDPRLAADPYFQLFERFARVSWEGFWVREWADEVKRPPRVQSPFLALNPWITILRCPPGVKNVQRRFTVPGKLHVLIIASNPPPGASHQYQHLLYLDDMVDTAWDILHKHKGIGWVSRLREPTKVEIAAAIREHKPHVVIYVGHGYANVKGSGLVLAKSEGRKEFEEVSGLRKGTSDLMESQLERVLAGKVEALVNPDAQDEGLPIEERPRLFIALACEAAPAAPALLQCGVPAVLAMRRQIPDHLDTVTMVQNLVTFLTEQEKPVDTGLTDLRQALTSTRPHWSVPVLHLATKDGLLFPDEEQFARGEYIRHMRQRCGRFERTFRDSPMNELTDATYQQQTLGEWVKEQVFTPQGLQEREVEHQREFRKALELHRKVVVIGRAGRGKTSLLYWAVLASLAALEHDKTAVVPVYVPLKDLQEAGNLQAYLRGQFSDERILNWLWGHVQKGNVLLLLDALDEVPREARMKLLNARSILADLVRTVTAPQAHLVLTCRDSVYTELSERLSELKQAGEREGFVKLELKRFGREQIIAYARQFFRDEQRAQAFLKDIEDPRKQSSEDKRSSRYTHLAEEPLYLHMLCWLWAGLDGKGEVTFQLPAAEDDLWHQVVVRLLEQRDVDEEQANNHLQLLEELAFHYRLCGKSLTRAFVEDAVTWLAEQKKFGSPREKAQEWLADLERWELLLRRGSGNEATYEFAIPTLDEYFAAAALKRLVKEPEGRRWLFAGETYSCQTCHTVLAPFSHYFWHSDWHDTISLLAGLLEDATPLLERIQAERDDAFHQMLTLAACCLGSAREVDKAVGEEIVKAVCQEWKKAVREGRSFGTEALGALSKSRQEKGAEQVRAFLCAELKDENGVVREAAARALGKLQDPRAVAPLCEALKDKDRDVREAAAWALGELQDPRAVTPLCKALKDENRDIRRAAARALGELGDPGAVRPLLSAARRQEEKELWEALQMLSQRAQIRVYGGGKWKPLPPIEPSSIEVIAHAVRGRRGTLRSFLFWQRLLPGG
jgi:hypothetical protein